MRLTWNKSSNAYEAVEKEIFKQYSKVESFIVQLRLKSKEDDEWIEVTELLLNDGNDYLHPKHTWINDWWEGEQIVELVAVAPVSCATLTDEWKV